MSPVGILAILLAITIGFFWRQSFRIGQSADSLVFPGLVTPERLAAYDQLWCREESQLWEWLEDRLQLDESNLRSRLQNRDRSMSETMNDRQVDDAIRVTEERLQALKGMVDRRKRTTTTWSSEPN